MTPNITKKIPQNVNIENLDNQNYLSFGSHGNFFGEEKQQIESKRTISTNIKINNSN